MADETRFKPKEENLLEQILASVLQLRDLVDQVHENYKHFWQQLKEILNDFTESFVELQGHISMKEDEKNATNDEEIECSVARPHHFDAREWRE